MPAPNPVQRRDRAHRHIVDASSAPEGGEFREPSFESSGRKRVDWQRIGLALCLALVILVTVYASVIS